MNAAIDMKHLLPVWEYFRAAEIGSRGVVSEILTGKRELNIRQDLITLTPFFSADRF